MPFILLIATIILSACRVQIAVSDFNSCVAAGNPVMESYPRQCRYQDQSYTEDIGNELELQDTIILNQPRPNQTLTSPVTLIGQARGTWFFEASFPVKLLDSSNQEIATGIAQAQGEWMTEGFVPFTATLTFPAQPPGSTGTLMLQKDNPADIPENDLSLTVPVLF
jgi:hypothetical protein